MELNDLDCPETIFTISLLLEQEVVRACVITTMAKDLYSDYKSRWPLTMSTWSWWDTEDRCLSGRSKCYESSLSTATTNDYIEDIENCTNAWYNYTEVFNPGADTYNGGASMIWPRQVSNKQFTNLSIVIAPGGGGGASAVLDYEAVTYDLRNGYSIPNGSTPKEEYDFHVNAHILKYLSTWSKGTRCSTYIV